MRKAILTEAAATPGNEPRSPWLDLEAIATAEVSSEDEHFPIEQALSLSPAAGTAGWRASATGPQTIRLVFDTPIALRRIQLHFVETTAARGHEFSFAVSSGSGEPFRDLHRQQYTFSPGGSTEEIEDYTVDLVGVKVFELRIDPDRSHDPRQSQHYATLASLRLA
jgi:hypothetical protein